jgi:hypothetical protein
VALEQRRVPEVGLPRHVNEVTEQRQPSSMSMAALNTMRACTTAGTRSRKLVTRSTAANTGADRSPSPGTSPMIASMPNRMFVPGTRNALSSSVAHRRRASRSGPPGRGMLLKIS